MPIDVLMPALSPTMTEGNLMKWYKQEGDSIKAGDVLAEIETDKAMMEVEAVDEGVLAKILVPGGSDNVKVNTVIGIILEAGESLDSLKIPASTPEKAPTVAQSDVANNNKPSAASNPSVEAVAPLSSTNEEPQRIFASPLARRIATLNEVDLKNLKGSGPRGRIVKQDVEDYIAAAPTQQSSDSKKPPAPSLVSSPALEANAFTDVNLTGMRRTIAKRLTESKQTVPHFYLTVDCHLDALLALRAQINTLQSATKVSVNDCIIRACALALIDVPHANATYHDTFVRLYSQADVAVAVAIEGGLVTPIVRHAHRKSIVQISLEMKELVEKAKTGKLKPEEFKGGSFSLSNLGMYGIKQFDAILNPPQASILAIGAGEQRAVVKDGAISMATVMTCTLSVDHRVIDGAVGAQFLNAIKGFIETPLKLVI